MMQMVGGGGEPPLPSDYQRLLYVIGTGGGNYSRTQGVQITTFDDSVYKFSSRVRLITNVHQWYSIFLAKDTTDRLYFQGGMCYLWGVGLGSPVITTAGSDLSFDIVVNGREVTFDRNGSIFTGEAPYLLSQLACNVSFRMSNLQGGTAAFYDTYIYNGSRLIAHFIPCKRISDDVCGFFEVFSGNFLFGDAGTPWGAGTLY